MIAAVFDCMVFLQAATNPQGPAFACLEYVETNQVRLFLSPEILAEIRDVLSRPDTRARFPHLTLERADLFVQKLTTLSVLFTRVPDAGISLRDPRDLPYLNLAITANTDYLISRDKDLLDLMQDPTFLRKCPQLRIVNPVAFLGIVRPAQIP